MVYDERQMQGGFIWDFVDQGLAEFKDGKKYGHMVVTIHHLSTTTIQIFV